MKTAVSIPDDVFDAAEDLARRSNISRSELYARALKALLEQDQKVTDTLNHVYGDSEETDAAITQAARRTFSNSTW